MGGGEVVFKAETDMRNVWIVTRSFQVAAGTDNPEPETLHAPIA